MRLRTPFLGQAYVARSKNLVDDRLLNLYPEAAPPGEGKDTGMLIGTPGLVQVATASTGPIRGICSFFNVHLFWVSGTTLYYIDAIGDTPTSLGTISGTSRVAMVPNQEGRLFIVADNEAWIYNTLTSTLSQVTPATITVEPGGSCDYLGSYFLFEQNATSSFYLFDGVTFDALDFGVTESTPDHIIAVLADHNEAWLFSDLSTEVWAHTGDADFPFQLIPGAVITQGCVAKFTPCRLDNSVFWLGRNEHGQGVVWRANGYTPVRVSTNALESAIQSYGDISDAFAFAYQQEGHSFYVLTFPSATDEEDNACGKTWVYDASTNLWHERGSVWPDDTDVIGRWRPNCGTFFQGEIVVGDFYSGKLYTLDLDSYSDGQYGAVVSFSPSMASSEISDLHAQTAIVATAGTGYERADVLTARGGVFTRPAKFMVANNASGSGVTALALVDAGAYIETPANPVELQNGTGTGCYGTVYWTASTQTVVSERCGSGYTSSPTLTITGTATATARLQLVAARIFVQGTGYVVGDTLTVSGGTATVAATVQVAAIGALGAVTAVAIVEPGTYSAAPAGASVSLTGGSGSLVTATLFWGLGDITLTSGGSGYTANPTVTVGGAGSGASVDALVDTTSVYIKRLRSWRAIPQGQNNLVRTMQHSLILDAQAGVGADGSGPGTDATVMLRWSDDGGHTWSNEHDRSLGESGSTGHRCYWRRLGSTEKLRDRVYELSVSDPVKIAFIGAYIDASAAAS